MVQGFTSVKFVGLDTRIKILHKNVKTGARHTKAAIYR